MSLDFALRNQEQNSPSRMSQNLDRPAKNTPETPRMDKVSHTRPSSAPRSRSSESIAGSHNPQSKRPPMTRSPDTSPRLESIKSNDKDTKSNNSNGSAANPPKNGTIMSDLGTSPSAENVSMKKRLVEQFYKMDGKSKPARSVEGPRTNGTSFGGPLEKSPAAFRDLSRDLSLSRDFVRGSRDPSRTTSAEDVGAACVAIAPFDDNLLDNTAVGELISHIDINGAAGQHELAHVTQLMREAASALEREPRFHEPFPSGQKQLLKVEKYLDDVQDSVQKVIRELGDSIAGAKTQYSEQTQKSMAKVAKLGELLHTLGERVEKAKKKLARSRDFLQSEIGEKIVVLEDVSARFEAYNQETRRRRVRQVSAALGLAAVLAAVYMAAQGVTWH